MLDETYELDHVLLRHEACWSAADRQCRNPDLCQRVRRMIGRTVDLGTDLLAHQPVEVEVALRSFRTGGRPRVDESDVLQHKPSYSGRACCDRAARDQPTERVADQIDLRP